MTITHITPREQELQSTIDGLRHQVEFWKKQSVTLAAKVTQLEHQLDDARRVVSNMDRRILRGGK